MKTYFILALACLKVGIAFSQPALNDFQWAPDTELKALMPSDPSVPHLTLLDERTVEFDYNEEGNLVEYFLYHEIMYLNSDEAIDNSNKIYMSLNRAIELVRYDARVLQPDGTIKSIGKDVLKEGVTEDQRKYNYFAMEGATKGAIAEYYYIVKRYPSYSGNYITFQGSTPVKKSVFKLISPKNLVFSTKSLNGYPELVADTTSDGSNLYHAEALDIPKLPEEPFGNSGGNKMTVLYHLHQNTATGKTNIYNYGDASQSVMERLNADPGKKASKAMDKILKEAQVKLAADDRDRIFKIENYVKEHFAFVEGDDDRLSDLEFILDNNACSSYGAVKLLYQLYKKAGVPLEVVLTTNRYRLRFDPEFESYAFLDEYLFYFPQIDDYLAPDVQLYRVGIIPYGLINNYGLFIKNISVGGIETGAGKVKFIKPYPEGHTLHNLAMSVDFDESLSSVKVDLEQEYTGFYAIPFQPYFTYITSEKDRTEFEEGITKNIHEDIEIGEIEIKNEGVSMVMRAPFIVNCDYSSSAFMERAGDKVLFRVGELIGPQTELYQEEERVLPVENDYNRLYNRSIVFTLPDGYKCSNLEDLNLSVQPFLEKGDEAGFVSTFTQTGNEVRVEVKEYYRSIGFDKADYPAYRDVINAAADFNKITLVFEAI